ncbi:hypothetical protein HanXRQr2_Chr13g0585191 [Helianthus annuus]|uniref:Enhanced disease resistance 4-like N-terminal domain-containing protein n=1 Tax=Helianthus annuus TaxID=4232 RepID=A0A9K3HBE3_HELAN|nr:hypothetical protein HanXRQr2_Chr13g0585191 [Helianthus annuus]KAJ0848951.1 hypothetical protein HanPSC8_Chr13g0563381 [Helianthus annuus]
MHNPVSFFLLGNNWLFVEFLRSEVNDIRSRKNPTSTLVQITPEGIPLWSSTSRSVVKCPRCVGVLPESPNVSVYKSKKRNKSNVDTTPQRLDEGSSGKQVENVLLIKKLARTQNQQSLINSIDVSVQNSDHNDLNASNKD